MIDTGTLFMVASLMVVFDSFSVLWVIDIVSLKNSEFNESTNDK